MVLQISVQTALPPLFFYTSLAPIDVVQQFGWLILASFRSGHSLRVFQALQVYLE